MDRPPAFRVSRFLSDLPVVQRFLLKRRVNAEINGDLDPR